MGWTNYWYNKKLKVAFDIGKFDYNDYYEGTYQAFEKIYQYREEEDMPNKNVLEYLWNETFMHEAHSLMINLMMDWFGTKDDTWEVISENELPKDVDVIARGDIC